MKDVDFSSKLEEMREEFDRSFAVAPHGPAAELEDFLGIRVAGDPYAVRIAEVASLDARRQVVPLPAADAALLGLAGVRGKLVPVYSLAALLGYANTTEAGRWLLVAGRDESIGLAFDELEGYLRTPRSDVLTVDAHEKLREHIQETLRSASGTRHIICLSSLISAIKTRAEAPSNTGEEI